QYKDCKDLASAPTVLMGKDAQFSFWPWRVKEFGFKDAQLRPYNYSLAQFLNDQKVVQQAYATAEPSYAEKEGAKVTTYLLADYGYSTYGNTIETRQDLIEKNPDLVQRFVSASVEGWTNFLYSDRSKAYELILKDNPDMSKETLDAELERIKNLQLIDSGDTLEKGIGAISMDRVKAFYELARKAGIVSGDELDMSKVATDAFVNKGAGLDIKKKLGQSAPFPSRQVWMSNSDENADTELTGRAKVLGRRRRILGAIRAAAIDAFAEKGLAGASTQGIAHRAGLTKPQLHYYISSKEELYEDIIVYILDEWEEIFLGANTEDDPDKVIRQYIRAKLEYSQKNPKASRLFTTEIANGA